MALWWGALQLGMSALHFAAMNNQYEICQVLLNGGINKDSKTKVDRTPLHLACYYGNEQIVELLISKNCAVNTKDFVSSPRYLIALKIKNDYF